MTPNRRPAPNARAWLAALLVAALGGPGVARAEDAKTWFAKGSDALRGARFEEAAADYARAEALATTDTGRASAANSAGYALFKGRKYEAAIGALQRAVGLDPAHKTAWSTLGVVYLQTYESGLSGTAALDSAIAALTRAADVNPATKPDNLETARGDLAQEQAWAAAAAARAGQPPRAPAAVGTWSAYRAAGEAAEREADFDLAGANYARAEAVGVTPRSKSAAANFQGLLALRRHRPVDALAAFRRATTLDPTSQFAWNNLGVAALRAYAAGAGDKPLVEESVAAFGKVHDLNPAYKPENLAWATGILTELGGPSSTVAADSSPGATTVVPSATGAAGSAARP